MKRIKFWTIFCCLLTLAGFVRFSSAQNSVAPSTTTDVTALRQQFKTELTSLRTEMLQQGIDFQEWKIKQLERESQRLNAERGQLEEAEQSLLRQLAAVEQSLQQSDAPSNSEHEGMKNKLNGTHLQGIRNKRQPLDQQWGELQAQLQQEHQQLQTLQKKLAQLKAESAPQTK
jgi:chromosome segregation ATPase